MEGHTAQSACVNVIQSGTRSVASISREPSEASSFSLICPSDGGARREGVEDVSLEFGLSLRRRTFAQTLWGGEHSSSSQMEGKIQLWCRVYRAQLKPVLLDQEQMKTHGADVTLERHHGRGTAAPLWFVSWWLRADFKLNQSFSPSRLHFTVTLSYLLVSSCCCGIKRQKIWNRFGISFWCWAHQFEKKTCFPALMCVEVMFSVCHKLQ